MTRPDLRFDMGDDDGIAEIVIGGKSIRFSPLEECSKLEAALPRVDSETGPKTEDVIRVMRDRLKNEYEIEVSPDMALGVYRAVIELNRRVSANFTKKLASQGLSDSTREASSADEDGECLPPSTELRQSNLCGESPNEVTTPSFEHR